MKTVILCILGAVVLSIVLLVGLVIFIFKPNTRVCRVDNVTFTGTPRGAYRSFEMDMTKPSPTTVYLYFDDATITLPDPDLKLIRLHGRSRDLEYKNETITDWEGCTFTFQGDTLLEVSMVAFDRRDLPEIGTSRASGIRRLPITEDDIVTLFGTPKCVESFRH